MTRTNYLEQAKKYLIENGDLTPMDFQTWKLFQYALIEANEMIEKLQSENRILNSALAYQLQQGFHLKPRV